MKKLLILALSSLILAQPTNAITININYRDRPTKEAVLRQTAELSNLLLTRIGLQGAVAEVEEGIRGQLRKLNELEEKRLQYLSNAQTAVQGIYQIKRIFDLSKSVVADVYNLGSEIPKNTDGAVVAAAMNIISGTYLEVGREVADCVLLVEKLVTGATTTETTYDAAGNRVEKRGNVNLLNGGERYMLAQQICGRLSRLDHKVKMLRNQVRNLNLNKVFRDMTIEIYYDGTRKKQAMNALIGTWRMNAGLQASND